MSDLAVRLEPSADGVTLLVLDDADRSTNTMNQAYWAGMDAALKELREAGDSIRGVVVTSAKKTFFAGGDLAMLRGARPGDEAKMRDIVERSTRQLRELETLEVPVVAAIAGSALGGGLEIALACHHRIAVDTDSIRVGLPEITFGILPAANGLIRTVRMLGVRAALSKVLLTGATYTPRQAEAIGLLDELVTDRDQLLVRARQWIIDHPDAKAPWDVDGFAVPDSESGTDEESILANLPANVQRIFAGYPMPGPRAVLSAACRGAGEDFATASEFETSAFIDLVCDQIATNQIQAKFFDMQTIRAGGARPAGFDRFRAQRAAVIGAGMMGTGIAQVCAQAGMDVVLLDRDAAVAERGRAMIERALAWMVSAQQATAIVNRIRAADDIAEVASCDLVIEAVFEDQALKQSIFKQVEEVSTGDTVLASNTSTLPITGLAQATQQPGKFIGLHFFSPVPRMPLVEVIAGQATDPHTLAKGINVVTQLGKTPIVVSDSRGFFTSRVIVKRLIEAMAMIAEGIDPVLIENAAVRAGYPVGPLALLDELTVALVDTVRQQAREAAAVEGKQWTEHPGDRVAAAMVHEHGRIGRTAGGGFYNYIDGSRGPFWEGLAAYHRENTSQPDERTVADRLLFAEVVDTFRCLDEGVLKSTADANVGSLLGIGFPTWTGGVVQFAVGYPGGPEAFGARAAEFREKFGACFELPSSWLSVIGGSDD